MSRLQKIGLFGLILAIGALVYLEATQPKPLNWFPSYHQDDTIPLGTKVLYTLLEDAVTDRFQVSTRPPFEVLKNDSLSGTLLFVNDYIAFEETEINLLLDWIAEGNTVFIAANSFSERMLDTLHLKLNTALLADKVATEPMLNLIHPDLKSDTPYHIDRDLTVRYLEVIDTLHHSALGVVDVFNESITIENEYVNFLKVPVQQGTLYLHTQPEVFSNYFMLKNTHHAYTENVLAYLPQKGPIIWDAYYKSGKRIQTSPLYLLLNNRYLKWAYYTVLIGVFLFVIFEGKRKQRSIPIIPPVTNRTYEFTRTIAGMYLENKEYKAIIEKQIALFFEYIRTTLRVPTEQQNSRFIEAIASRSNNSIEDTKALLSEIKRLQTTEKPSKTDVTKLHQHITEFKSKIDGTS